MSYCRFSTDDFHCDVYCYEDAYGGYTTHVANNRYTESIPVVDWTSSTTLYDSYRSQVGFMANLIRQPIGLPYDGQTYNDEFLSGLCRRLVELQSVGYRVPQFVIDNILTEMEEGVL